MSWRLRYIPGTLAELERQTGWRTARYTTRDQEAS